MLDLGYHSSTLSSLVKKINAIINTISFFMSISQIVTVVKRTERPQARQVA